MIIKTDYRIDSVTTGYQILLRNKHVTDGEHELPGNAVLFVHGATYGSTHTFDYEIDGESWMDKMAGQGFDAWCIDLLGYGGSDRPVEMLAPAEDNDPIVDTAHAVQEVDLAVDFICRDRGIDRLSLIGYSWGTAICGSYAGEHAEKVNRLVLSGALWVEGRVEGGNAPRAISAGPGAYRTVDVESAVKRWGVGLSQAEIDSIVPPARVRQWCGRIWRGMRRRQHHAGRRLR